MLTSEQAHERLKGFENPHHQKDQLQRILPLGGGLSYIGQIFVQGGPAWKGIDTNRDQIAKAQLEAFGQLGKLKPQDRQKLFRAFFPKLSTQVEAAWKLFDLLPYQTSYYRRPFRQPNNCSTEARSIWLQRLLFATRGYDQDITWFAAWAPYLGYGAGDRLGYLFAGAIESGGETGQEVFDILIASANGSHEIGMMGRHVVRGLLCSSRPEGWEFIERLLLAAQREEGLRQVILESVDEAHPQAFRRLLRLILEHDLIRFSSTIRAFNVWFGLASEAISQKTLREYLARVLCYLDDPTAREKAIYEGSPEEQYFALWATAFEDVHAALPFVIQLRRSPSVECRFVATHILAQMALAESFEELLDALDDPDMRIAIRAFLGLNIYDYPQDLFNDENDLFEHLERLITRLRHRENTFKPLVWDWFVLKINREQIAGYLIGCLGKRSPKRLIPYLDMMEPFGRSNVAQQLKKIGKKDAEARQVLMTLVGDPSSHVRESALSAAREFDLTEQETLDCESLLKRKAEDLRRGVIQILLDLPDRAMLQSAERLLGQKNEDQRRASLEILQKSTQANRCARECRLLASEYRKRPDLLEPEVRILEDILAGEVQQYSLADALGLMDPKNRTKPTPPRATGGAVFGHDNKVRPGTRAAVEILKSLNELVERHRTEPIEVTFPGKKQTELLGNVSFQFPDPNPTQPLEQGLAQLPLKEVWETWWKERPEALRDSDGFELIRALAILKSFQTQWGSPFQGISELPAELQAFFGIRCDFKLNYTSVVSSVLRWMILSHPAQGEISFLLDALELSVSQIPRAELIGVREIYAGGQARAITQRQLPYLQLCRWQRAFRLEAWKDEHHARFWSMMHWLDEPKPGLPRYYPQLEDIFFALRAGAATKDDLLDLLLGPRDTKGYGSNFHFLRELSGRKPHPLLSMFPGADKLVDACRERILSIEIRRGDLPTEATLPAMDIRSVPGMKNLFHLLTALGRTSFERGYHFSKSRQAVLSKLIQVTYPIDEDTPEGFAELVKTHRISERRLVELAVYAPQWSSFVETTLGWPKLQEAVFWIYAHTKDRQWAVEPEIKELWAAQISEFTPLSADSLMDGAVDVAWFHQVYKALEDDQWQEMYQAAELTSSGNGHTRARIFADAMLGRATSDQLIDRMAKKRHQDSVRALGLVPLPADGNRQPEILRRYETMQEFLRTSKKFGSQRQASEKLAVTIGIENLARTAGYTDPQRLEWAMEIEEIADLANGPMMVEVEGTCVSLSINDLGEPEITITRNGKWLKAIPPKAKRDERIKSLLDRRRKLDRQTSRMRQSLEQAMCRGETFRGAELSELFRHPMLRTMIEQLVFVGPSGMGFPLEDGKALFVHSGQTIPVALDDPLRIAHPFDLLESGEWPLWQRECFISERIQPFKQVFRELYIVTETEKEEENLSRRYAGHQVNPRQALALFGARGWVTDPEEGVHKTFHDLGISARVSFLQGAFTPAEVEGLTIETVAFTRRGEWSPLPLSQIARRVFSEVMRDLDMVVSVAHAGGIDPEASASSIEAREALIRETCGLLNLDNVQVKERHALIGGKLGNYTIHLGSAMVHKQPGGALCIIPVHSQQRGRLFLPFVDQDPKSAEVVSKVILLAKDSEIRDPTILEQILR